MQSTFIQADHNREHTRRNASRSSTVRLSSHQIDANALTFSEIPSHTRSKWRVRLCQSKKKGKTHYILSRSSECLQDSWHCSASQTPHGREPWNREPSRCDHSMWIRNLPWQFHLQSWPAFLVYIARDLYTSVSSNSKNQNATSTLTDPVCIRVQLERLAGINGDALLTFS